jgi:hypothetical protein
MDFQQILGDIVAQQKAEVILIDNTEILFDTSLEQDPIKCITNISRDRNIIASWNGKCINGTLTYAEPSHFEFKEYKIEEIDALILSIGSAQRNEIF